MYKRQTPEFIFKSGDSADFIQKIETMLNGEVWLEEYWKNAMAPYSMEDHLNELRDVYAQPARSIALMPSAPPESEAEDALEEIEDAFAGLSETDIEAAESKVSTGG